jgi:thiamine-monophosphate kinase
VGDLQHICDASHVGATIEIACLPLSDAAREAVVDAPGLLDAVIAGGDDYELLFTASPSHQDALISLGREVGVPVTRIGSIDDGKSVRVIDSDGKNITPTQIGYRHF